MTPSELAKELRNRCSNHRKGVPCSDDTCVHNAAIAANLDRIQAMEERNRLLERVLEAAIKLETAWSKNGLDDEDNPVVHIREEASLCEAIRAATPVDPPDGHDDTMADDLVEADQIVRAATEKK